MSRNLFQQYSPINTSKTPIYALCDYELLVNGGISLNEFIKICTSLDVPLIQYRDKINTTPYKKKNLIFLKEHSNISIIINDNIELIQYANGLHLGQEDLKNLTKKNGLKNSSLFLKALRKKYPYKILGLSTHNEMEILQANALPLDYIGLGTYRNTLTKNISTNPLGQRLSYLAKISKHPVCAIGGVRVDDVIDNISYNVIGSNLYPKSNSKIAPKI